MKKYSFWDIPSVMVNAVRSVVSIGEEACVLVVDADSVKSEIEELVKGSKVKVVFLSGKLWEREI